MDNQHKLIKGYRDLSQAEIDLMNEIKAKGEELEALCTKVSRHLSAQAALVSNEGGEALDRYDAAEPQRWKAMARTDLQTGIMKLVRAVAQPTSF